MSSPFAHLHVATGDGVARVRLDDGRPAAVDAFTAVPATTCVAVDPRDPSRVYLGTFDHGLLVSNDAGESWQAPETQPADPRVLSLAVSAADAVDGVSVAYAGTEPSNLYRSGDGGRTWRLLPALRELPSEPRWSFPGRPWTHHVKTIALHPRDPGRLLVGVELGGVMISGDGGETWADHNPEAHSDAHQLVTHPLAPERVYEAAGQGVAISEDRGDSWHRLEAGLDRRYAYSVAVDPADPDLWYVAISRGAFAAHGSGDGEARVLRSTDRRWHDVAAWGDEPALRRMPFALATVPERPGSLVAGLRGGALLIGADAGEHWERPGLGLADVIDVDAAPAA